MSGTDSPGGGITEARYRVLSHHLASGCFLVLWGAGWSFGAVMAARGWVSVLDAGWLAIGLVAAALGVLLLARAPRWVFLTADALEVRYWFRPRRRLRLAGSLTIGGSWGTTYGTATIATEDGAVRLPSGGIWLWSELLLGLCGRSSAVRIETEEPPAPRVRAIVEGRSPEVRLEGVPEGLVLRYRLWPAVAPIAGLSVAAAVGAVVVACWVRGLLTLNAGLLLLVVAGTVFSLAAGATCRSLRGRSVSLGPTAVTTRRDGQPDQVVAYRDLLSVHKIDSPGGITVIAHHRGGVLWIGSTLEGSDAVALALETALASLDASLGGAHVRRARVVWDAPAVRKARRYLPVLMLFAASFAGATMGSVFFGGAATATLARPTWVLHCRLAVGADPNETFAGATSALGLAVEQGARGRDKVALLLRYGADPNRADIWGHTPLQLARERGDEETVELLLDAGARP